VEDKSLGSSPTVWLYLDTDGGSVELAALELTAPGQTQNSAIESLPITVAIAAGVIVAVAVVIARRRSGRNVEETQGGPREEASGEAQGEETHKEEQGRGDLEEYWGSGGVWD